jgi:HlyD family secretion protein
MRPAMPCLRARDRAWIGAACLLILALPGCSKEDAGDANKPAMATVARGPLRITVTEGGALASARPVKIVNEMEGRATILWLVKEGARVEKDDVVVKLDSADVRDKINDFEVRVEQEAAAQKQAEEKLAIQLNQNESDVNMAKLNADFAKVDYDKYMKGDYPQKKKQAESELIIKEEELKRATDRVTWSRRLEEKKFITRTELEADELAAKKASIGVELAKSELEVLDKFEFVKESAKLMAERDEKIKELERVKSKAASEEAKARSDLNSRATTLRLAKERHQRAADQLQRSVIKAPASGTVVYAREDRGRMGSSEPVGEGKQLREREEILNIPDTRKMIVQLDIHESLVKKVREGQRASIRLDALPGKELTGRVRSVSSVPSTSNQWMNPDLKVYPTEIELDEILEDDLKPGMNAQAEILVADLTEVLSVPMQAIHQSGGRAFTYVNRGGKPEVVPVELGLNNDRAVVVKSGLDEGEQVYLSLPPGAPALPAPEPGRAKPKDEGQPAADGAGAPAGPRPGADPGEGGGGPPADGANRGAGMGRRPRGERPARPKDP